MTNVYEYMSKLTIYSIRRIYPRKFGLPRQYSYLSYEKICNILSTLFIVPNEKICSHWC